MKQIHSMHKYISMLGLSGIRYKGKKYYMDRKYLAISILECVLNVLSCLYLCYHLASRLRLTIAMSTGLGALVMAIFVDVAFTFTLNKCSIYQHLMSTCKLPIVNKEYHHSRLTFFNCMSLSIWVIMIIRIIVCVVAILIYIKKTDMLRKIIELTALTIDVTHMNLQRSVLAFIMTKIKEKYTILCNKLKQMIQTLDCSNIRIVEKNYIEIRRMLTVHNELRFSATNITKTFELSIFLLLLCNSTTFVLQPSIIVNRIRDDNVLNIVLLMPNILGVVIELLWFWFTVEPYQSILNLDEEFCHLLLDVLGKQLEEGNELESYETLENILRHRMNKRFAIDVFGTFNLDRSLIGSLFSAATTYSIVLIQYNSSIM